MNRLDYISTDHEKALSENLDISFNGKVPLENGKWKEYKQTGEYRFVVKGKTIAGTAGYARAKSEVNPEKKLFTFHTYKLPFENIESLVNQDERFYDVFQEFSEASNHYLTDEGKKGFYNLLERLNLLNGRLN